MADKTDAGTSTSTDMISSFLSELVGSPINIALLGVCAYLLYKIFSSKKATEPSAPVEPELKPLAKRDFTLEQLREYDGRDKEGRILMAVNNKVFDVTRGKRFYGPGGPYGVFAGRDASRGLATFSLNEEAIKDEYDDLTDLTSMQMDSILEWEMQFTEKYDLIGKLLKPGDKPTDYSAADSDEDQSSSLEKSKDD